MCTFLAAFSSFNIKMSAITIAESQLLPICESMILLRPHRKFATEAREYALNLSYTNGVYSIVAKNTMLLLYYFQDEIANNYKRR